VEVQRKNVKMVNIQHFSQFFKAEKVHPSENSVCLGNIFHSFAEFCIEDAKGIEIYFSWEHVSHEKYCSGF